MLDIDLLGLSAKRLNRSSYFLSMFVSMFLFVGFGLLLDAAIKTIFNIETVDDEPTLFFVLFIVAWWTYAIYNIIRRLHDLNMSSWWLIAAFVPFLSIYIGLMLLFAKGSSDPNKYGEPLAKTYILGLGI